MVDRFTEAEKKALKFVDDMLGDMPIGMDEIFDDEETLNAWMDMVNDL